MKLNHEVLRGLNDIINTELRTAYLYLAVACWCEQEGFHGFAHWFRIQAESEKRHGMILMDFVNRRRENVTLREISAPEISWKNIASVFETCLENEKQVTRQIYALQKLIQKNEEFSASGIVQWLLDKQVEEEDVFEEIHSQIEILGEHKSGLLVLDHRLKKRTLEAAAV